MIRRKNRFGAVRYSANAGAKVASGNTVIDLEDPADWNLGGRPSNTFLEGDLDEIRVSDVARTPAEIFVAACGR